MRLDLIGQDLGSYRVVSRLGKGGMATVFRGEHRVLGSAVAIKVLHSHHLENESIRKRFENEARAVASLAHPSIVELYDFGYCADGVTYIVMELLAGESLRDRMRRGQMPVEQIAEFGRQLSAALSVAHQHGIIHRDVKPGNIFLAPDPETTLGERAKLLDFGIAKRSTAAGPIDKLTATGIMIGTPAYMSPEQCRGEREIDNRSDIYSIGVVAYRMATAELPFEAAGTHELVGKHLHTAPRSPSELRPSFPPAMNAIIMRCLEKAPSERFRSAAELAHAFATSGCLPVSRISSAAMGSAIEEPPRAPVEPQPLVDESRLWRIAVASVSFVAVLVVIAFIVNSVQ